MLTKLKLLNLPLEGSIELYLLHQLNYVVDTKLISKVADTVYMPMWGRIRARIFRPIFPYLRIIDNAKSVKN